MNDEEEESVLSAAPGSDDVEHHPEYWRFHFPDDGLKLWKYLNKLGWKYSNPKYQAPPRPDGTPGQIFDSSKEVVRYLNSFAIPDVYTNLQFVDTPGDDDNASSFDHGNEQRTKARQEREIGLALRKAILALMYKKNDKALDNDDRFDAQEESSSDEYDDQETKQSKGGQRCKSARVAAASYTVTAMEKGADLYLRRRQTTKRNALHGKKNGKAIKNVEKNNQQRLSVQECRAFLEDYSMEQVEEIEDSYHAQFAQWRFLLSTNHSLLFYGAGSKRELLNSFAADELQKEGETLVIDGADDEVTINGILDVLVQVFLDGMEPTDLSAVSCRPENVPVIGKFCPWKTDKTVERAIMIGRGLAHQVEETKHSIPPSFLMIHSLDARLATPKAQEALAALVINSTVTNGVAALRLVASVDHVDAPTFLWDSVTQANFSWFPCCVHTHRPYLQELGLIEEDSVSRKKTERASRSNTQAQRILDVLQGLAPRHTEVVQLLAQLQSKQNEWVDYLQYRDRCKSACAVNKDSQLRHLLNELMDHGLIVQKTEGENEFYQIPFSAEKLQEIIDFERE